MPAGEPDATSLGQPDPPAPKAANGLACLQRGKKGGVTLVCPPICPALPRPSLYSVLPALPPSLTLLCPPTCPTLPRPASHSTPSYLPHPAPPRPSRYSVLPAPPPPLTLLCPPTCPAPPPPLTLAEPNVLHNLIFFLCQFLGHF